MQETRSGDGVHGDFDAAVSSCQHPREGCPLNLSCDNAVGRETCVFSLNTITIMAIEDPNELKDGTDRSLGAVLMA